jgi:signal transduction histidine kinase
VARQNLGLFDTPPNRREIQLGLATVALQFVSLLVILPLHDMRLGEMGAFVPMVDTVMLVGELIIATKLYAQAAIFRSRALTILASGYLFCALLYIPHALTFPGAFAPDGLLGAGVSTTAWFALLNVLAFPIAVILYVLLKSAESAARPQPERPAARVIEGLAGAIALALLATIMATGGQNLLPSLFVSHSQGIFLHLAILGAMATVLTLAAMALLSRQDKSVLDLWLLVALSGWLFELMLSFAIDTRFTLGWYGLFGMQAVSSFIVMIALIAETNRLYAQLALSTAAREREHEARLMSMDAVTTAISHEIGQPLASAKLNAKAGLNWLDREKPDPGMASKSISNAIEDCQRAFDVMKSIRAMVAKGSGSPSEFSLNGLVRETASLLAGELAARNISLKLALDEPAPPIMADRVQLQRVLVNLLTNAIESVGETRRRTRWIEIRSAPFDDHDMLIEVSDSGVGIAPDKIEHIFEPFVTTKSTGTGLGLSLCRIIVVEHGGRLWASRGDEYGATFHLQMPRNPFATQ